MYSSTTTSMFYRESVDGGCPGLLVFYLAGTAAGIGGCGIGVFSPDQVNALGGVNGETKTPVHLSAAGWPKV